MIAWMQKMDDDLEQHIADEQEAIRRFRAAEAAREVRAATRKNIAKGAGWMALLILAIYLIFRYAGLK